MEQPTPNDAEGAETIKRPRHVKAVGDEQRALPSLLPQHAPRLDRNIGYVLLDNDAPTASGELTVITPEGVRDVELTQMPFIDRDKREPRKPLR